MLMNNFPASLSSITDSSIQIYEIGIMTDRIHIDDKLSSRKLLFLSQQTFTCTESTINTLKRCEMCSNLTVEAPELTS